MNLNQHSGPGPPQYQHQEKQKQQQQHQQTIMKTLQNPSNTTSNNTAVILPITTTTLISTAAINSSNKIHNTAAPNTTYDQVDCGATIGAKLNSNLTATTTPSIMCAYVVGSSNSMSSSAALNCNTKPSNSSALNTALGSVNNKVVGGVGVGSNLTNGCLTNTQIPPPVARTISSDRLVTGPSCKALRTAVSALYSVDDFVKEKIGSGFFSEVYKVTHRTTGQVMVLKMNQLRANRPNMLREVQLLNKLSHPNILSFMGVCVQEGQLHALTEYISGGSLEQLLANKEVTLSPAAKIKLALGITRGMAYVHDAGIFHRDLTSKNVLVRNLPDGQFESVVGDFGLAAKIPDKKQKTRLEYVGSPYWVSPECLNHQFYDERSDVFSFGIISCEIIARIEADPDIMPRTDSFGFDYLAFIDLCPMDTPPAFLRLAFYCCIFDPKSRPTFHDCVNKLTSLLEKYNHDPLGCNGSTNSTAVSASSSPLSSLEMTCSPNGSDTENFCQTVNHKLTIKKPSINTPLTSCLNTAPADHHMVPPRYLREVSENGFLFPDTENRSNSIPNGGFSEIDENRISKNRVKRATKKYENMAAADLLIQQQHRRSLSENIIHFPLHTTPSDKARCHQMQRQRSSTHSPTPPPVGGSVSATTIIAAAAAETLPARESPPPVLTLRKVAETMCLKDPQYKPIRTDNNGVKSNPFTALAHLKGVKKILGANPKIYAAGGGDLFSSCFEICAPFFKELVALQQKVIIGDDGKTIVTSPSEPKSLPTSPQLTRKLSAIEMKLSPTLNMPRCLVAEEDDDCCDESDNEQDADGGGNCADAESSSDDSAERPTPAPVSRKYRANSLYTHPLFRGPTTGTSKTEEAAVLPNSSSAANVNIEDCNSSEDGCEEGLKSSSKEAPLTASTPSPPTPPPQPSAALTATPASISLCTDFDLNEIKQSDFLPTKSSLTRRDSIESGFYSCFNEESDAATTYRQFSNAGVSSLGLGCGGSNCCFEQLKSQLMLEVGANGELSDKLASLCRCCYYGSASQSGRHQQILNDSSSNSSSVLLIDEPTSSGAAGINNPSSAAALRSLDDLELPDAARSHRRYTCHHHLLGGGNYDSNFTATAGLINRLALDSEIHSLMQRSPFATNQLLYCKNRTSSIYTDSSDDISSLAGSDSLLWDERSFAYPTSTRSAQIAKIVEYFERKRQVPDSTPPLRSSGGGGHDSATASGSTSSSSSMAAAVAASALGSSYLSSYETRQYSDFKRHTALNSDYEAFCFDLDKKPSQARLMVCEGAVKSKLQIFDKLKQQHQQRPTCSIPNTSSTTNPTQTPQTPLAVASQICTNSSSSSVHYNASGASCSSASMCNSSATTTTLTTSVTTASTGSITPTQQQTSTSAKIYPQINTAG